MRVTTRSPFSHAVLLYASFRDYYGLQWDDAQMPVLCEWLQNCGDLEMLEIIGARGPNARQHLSRRVKFARARRSRRSPQQQGGAAHWQQVRGEKMVQW